MSFFYFRLFSLHHIDGIKFFRSLFNVKPSNLANSTYDIEDNDVTETSQGDGLMGIDVGDDYTDILFPEEFDDEV
jgi:hypothetical protein